MSIEAIKSAINGIEGLSKPAASTEGTKEGAKGGLSFGDMLKDALQEVNHMQKSADVQIEGLVLGKDGVTSHGAMIALEKADVAFQLMSNIRAKIIRAYEEVIRTQV